MNAVIIGSGKVATLLGKSLAGAGHTIVQVAGRNTIKTRALAKKLHAEPVALLGPVIKTADIYLICVSDNAISEAAKSIAGVKGMVVHTSGTTPIAAVSKYHKRSGVMWPVVSIGSRNIRLKNVPLCLEAGDKKTEKSLLSFACSISDQVHLADSSKREVLHLTAVITNNFTNHLHNAAFALLAKHQLDREILYTLIKNTAANILNPGPEFSQTGPAVRGDTRTIDRHLKLLKNNPDLQEIYAAITSGIINHKAQ